MRKILAIAAGALIGSLTLLLIGAIANTISPTPPELMDPATPEAVAQRVNGTSLSTWLTVILGLALGAFLGGAAGAGIARAKTGRVASGVGLLLSLWAFYTLYVVYPEQLWVPLAMLIVVFVFSNLGGRLIGRSQGKTHA